MGSDGMTIDAAGNVYLTGKGVTIFSRAGRKIGEIPDPRAVDRERLLRRKGPEDALRDRQQGPVRYPDGGGGGRPAAPEAGEVRGGAVGGPPAVFRLSSPSRTPANRRGVVAAATGSGGRERPRPQEERGEGRQGGAARDRRAGPPVRLHQLEGFFQVGEHGGFARAARAIPYPITEPALHQQVRKLERHLEVRLIERAPGRRMALTPEGRMLHRFVRPFFVGLPAALRAAAAGEGGGLVVGAEPLYIDGLCSRAIARLERRRPGSVMRLIELDVAEMAGGILRGDLDLGIASLEGPQPGLAAVEVGTLGLELLLPRGHPLARSRSAPDARRLSGHACVLYGKGLRARQFTDKALRRAGVEVTVAAEASSAGSIRALVRAGSWAAFVPVLGRPPRRRVHRTARWGST